MKSNLVYALLRDPSGSILLVRRRGSVLWGLPGGDLRATTSADDLLTTYCQRQVGVTPDFSGPLQNIMFAGISVTLAGAEVARIRAAARSRIEAISWAEPDRLPTEMEPVARMAVSILCSGLGDQPAPGMLAGVEA